MNNEVSINNLVDYVKAIFAIPSSNEVRDFKDFDKMLIEIQNFEEEKVLYNDITDRYQKSSKKKELIERLKCIVRYCQVLPLYRIMPTYRYQKDNGSFEKINNGSDAGIEYFYRGVYDGAKYNLLPSCFRNGYYGKEDKFYHYVKSRCVNELNNRNHLDTLVTLQHYECPTRLLDVTSNPLVALYFACKNYGCKNCDTSNYGYVYVFANSKSELLFKDSDRVIMLSCLARFTKEEQEEMYNSCVNLILKDGIGATFDKNPPKVIGKLYHEIMTEVSFEKRILAIDLLKNYFVQPDNSNKRIDKQSGAFIISGLSKDTKEIEDKINNHLVCRIKINDRDVILNQLDALNINEASLFPEIDKVAKYYTSKI